MSDSQTQSSTRRLVCEFMIAASICGGGYFFLVDSVWTKIAAVRADIATAQQEEASRAGVGSLTDKQVGELQRTTAERAEEIKLRSLPACDESVMFGRLSDLAAARTLRVEQLNPVQVQTQPLFSNVQAGTPAAAAAAQVAAPPEGTVPVKDTRVAYAIVVTGTYANLAAFVGELSNELGYTTVRSVRLSQPDLHEPDAVRAMITTEHLGIDLSNVKAAPTVADAKTAPAPGPAAPAAVNAATGHE